MFNRVLRWVANEPVKRASPGYQLFMLVLSVFSLAVLLLEVVFQRDVEVARVLDRADTFVCAMPTRIGRHGMAMVPDPE